MGYRARLMAISRCQVVALITADAPDMPHPSPSDTQVEALSCTHYLLLQHSARRNPASPQPSLCTPTNCHHITASCCSTQLRQLAPRQALGKSMSSEMTSV
jgi:hypothetical protein